MPDGFGIASAVAGAWPELDLHLFPKQGEAFLSHSTETLFGGSAGPGKSHELRVAAIQWCIEIPRLNVFLFRRVKDDLLKNHMEGPKGFRNMLAPWVKCGLVKVLDEEIRFWNGSRIFLCHCKDERHRYKYHGSEIHVLMIDELTTFTEIIYRYLRFRVRMVGIELPAHYRKDCMARDGTINTEDQFPRICNASNPGNIGHHWVKRTFGLDTGGMLQPKRQEDIEGGMMRQYIPARYTDNPRLLVDDPTYISRMRGLGDPALVRAMEEGDWNILAGGFFPEFRLERHVLEAHSLPVEIFSRRFRASDWGSAKPFSTGWYAIADEDYRMRGTLQNDIIIPRGALVRYREWYGKKQNQDNVGLVLPVETWASGVITRSKGEDVLHDVVDPSMFQNNGGPSLAERAQKTRVKGMPDSRIIPRPADNKRVGKFGAGVGWDQVRARLRGTDADEHGENGTPMLFFMDNQPDAIRIIQSVERDELKPEDVNTKQEDHAADEIRYACMSRPLPFTKEAARRPRTGAKHGTIDWLIQQGQGNQGSTYEME